MLPRLPASKVVEAAAAFSRVLEHPSVFNHSLRVYHLARAVADREGLTVGRDFDDVELAVACLLHDIGTADSFDGQQRFEVEGADAAVDFLRDWDLPQDATERVWQAIALHTSPQIAERMSPIVRLTRLGVTIDFGRDDIVDPSVRGPIEDALPRLDVERHLAGIVVSRALRSETKAPGGSWPGALLEAHRRGEVVDGHNSAF